MEVLMTVILLLVCLVISNIISHYVPSIPTALTQIAFGIIITIVFQEIQLEIETEWFLLLFVAPLLYNDGRHFPRDELWKMRASIFGNAIILVLLTTIGGGYFIHWLIPSIPLAAAFALAAILSPTDPVAVNGIAKRIHLPEKVLNLVRGESLINDASGLVAFNYAVAAVVTGYFSLREAILDFTYMFIAGAVLGLMLSLLMTWTRFTLRKKGISDVTLHSLLQLLTPFLIYIVTEEMLHASGVIAVVVGGIVHSLLRERAEPLYAEEQVLTENIWSTVLFILNGVVFLLLGLNIPPSIRSTVEDPFINNGLAIGYVLVIGTAILAIRFVWSYIFSYYEHLIKGNEDTSRPTIKMALLMSFTGVRGAITMAGVLSIPMLVESGAPFPERSLILFLAAGVILFTLIIATIFLPLLNNGEASEGEMSGYLDIEKAKNRLLVTAMNQIRSELNEDNKIAVYSLMDGYTNAFNRTNSVDDNEFEKKMVEVRLMALKAERRYIENAMDQQELDEELFEIFLKVLELREEALSRNGGSRLKFLVGNAFRNWKFSTGKFRRNRDKDRIAKRQIGRDIQLKASQAALEYLKAHIKEHEESIVYSVILDYKLLIERLKGSSQYNETVEAQKEELRIRVMDAERAEIHRMYENGEISNEQAKDLRRIIISIESVTLFEHTE
ncbi:Na+/H+ antiporter [Paenibacillus marinisediminis]